MTTVRDRISAALVAALMTPQIVVPGAIEVDPDGDPATFPGLALFDHGDRLVEREFSIERRVADCSIEGYVERAGGADGAADRNALHAAAVAAIMADDTLGGVVELIEMGDLRKMTARFSSTGNMMFSQDLMIEFTTKRTDPALPA